MKKFVLCVISVIAAALLVSAPAVCKAHTALGVSAYTAQQTPKTPASALLSAGQSVPLLAETAPFATEENGENNTAAEQSALKSDKQSALLSAGQSVLLPVIMYHKILDGVQSAYVVSPAQLEKDLLALKSAGFQAVFPSEVIAYAAGLGNLPRKPVLLTFDDGHYNNMHYALPLLKKHGQKAVINIIGAFSNYSSTSGDHSNPNYSHLTWAQIAKLQRSGCFEIGNHTYNMHSFKPRYGIDRTVAETDLQYRTNIYQDITRLQNKLAQECGRAPQVFAYPFGKFNDTAKAALLSMGFKMLLTCAEGTNRIYAGRPQCLHFVKRFNRTPEYTSARLIEVISKQ